MQDKSTLSVKTFDVGPMLNIVYLIWDNTTNDAAIVDPAWDLTEVLNVKAVAKVQMLILINLCEFVRISLNFFKGMNTGG